MTQCLTHLFWSWKPRASPEEPACEPHCSAPESLRAPELVATPGSTFLSTQSSGEVHAPTCQLACQLQVDSDVEPCECEHV